MTVNEELIDYLAEFVTENKREKIASVLAERTRYISVILEDIYQPHNASACLRSCECLGVQDLHLVEVRNTYRPNNEISMGSAKWLSMHRYNSTRTAIETVKTQGYRVVATTPNENGYDLATLPLDQPIALLFGTEEQGLTQEALEGADATMRLPMYGFTQSYNISVTLAITLSQTVARLRASEIDWRLSEEEQRELTLDFYRRIVKRHDLLEQSFWSSREH